MTEEVTITIEEYTKLVTERNGYQVGFTISLSILASLIAAALVCALIKYYIKEDNNKNRY